MLSSSHAARGLCRQNRQPCVCAWLSLPFLKATFNPIASLTLQTLILVLGFSSGPERGGQERGWVAQGCQGFAGAVGAPSSSHGGGPRSLGQHEKDLPSLEDLEIRGGGEQQLRTLHGEK